MANVFKKEAKKVLEEKLGWKDEWKGDPKLVERVQDVNLVTVQVVLALFTTLGSKQGPSCPDCLGFKLQIETLEKEKADLVSKIDCLETSLAQEKSDSEMLNKKVEDLVRENTTLTLENQQFKSQVTSCQKSFKGLKAANARWKRQKTSHDDSLSVEQVSACCHDSSDLGYIEVHRVSSDSRTFEGIHHFGSQSGNKQKNSGKPVIFAKISTSKVNSALSDDRLRERAYYLYHLLCLLSGAPFSTLPFSQSEFDNKELFVLLSKFASCYKTLCSSLLTKLRVLTPSEAVSLKSVLRLPMSSFRTLRTFFSNVSLPILPSEGKMRAEEKAMIDYLDDAEVEVEKISLRNLGKKSSHGEIYVLRCKNLEAYIRGVVKALILEEKISLDDAQNEIEVELLFGGDKGGQYMKFHFEVIYGQSAISVHDVHVFALYSGSDSVENMGIVLAPFHDVLKRMQESDYRLIIDIGDDKVAGTEQAVSYRVKVKLGGDFSFLDDCLGHQGSTSTFPSPKWTVTLKHLKNHGGKPHTPAHCTDVKMRSLREIHALFNENLVDDRQPKVKGKLTVDDEDSPMECSDLSESEEEFDYTQGPSKQLFRARGKDHGNFHHSIIFPISSLMNVVPPVLHIMLGVTLRLFNHLLTRCQELDHNEVSETEYQLRKDNENKWVESNNNLQEFESRLKTLGSNFIDLYNHRQRVEVIVTGEGSLFHVAANSQVKPGRKPTKKTKLKKDLKCDTFGNCFATRLDVLKWVLCTKCESWKHTVCQGITDTQWSELTDVESEFECLSCRGVTLETWLSHIDSRIQSVAQEEAKVQSQIDMCYSSCSQLAEKAQTVMGSRERALLDKLKEIEVERQAYHGKVFVGNHCKKVLAKHALLCGVLGEDPLKPKLVELFSVFEELRPLLFTKKTLDEGQVERVKTLCWKFGELYPVYFPKENIPRKIHELVFDVPVFVSYHKTIGRYSEEAGESLHNQFNQQLRRLACVRNMPQKLKLVLQGHEVIGAVDRSLTATPLRKCPKCKEKGQDVYFKKGLCKVCDAPSVESQSETQP